MQRALAAIGALCCGASVALSAYASHGLQAQAAHRAGLAALFLFGHGLALLLLAPGASGSFRRVGLVALLAGLLLFAGSLLAAVFVQAPTTLAPAGGLLLMLAWIIIAVDSFRR